MTLVYRACEHEDFFDEVDLSDALAGFNSATMEYVLRAETFVISAINNNILVRWRDNSTYTFDNFETLNYIFRVHSMSAFCFFCGAYLEE